MKPNQEKVKKFCPKCGACLVAILLPNEKPFWRNSLFSNYPYKVEGDAYSMKNGECLYRIEMECLKKEKTGFLGIKKLPHYGIYAEEDLTLGEVERKYNLYIPKC